MPVGRLRAYRRLHHAYSYPLEAGGHHLATVVRDGLVRVRRLFADEREESIRALHDPRIPRPRSGSLGAWSSETRPFLMALTSTLCCAPVDAAGGQATMSGFDEQRKEELLSCSP